MAGLRIEVDKVLVSFDVSSLFTNVFVNEAVQVIRDRLQQDEALADRTTLSPNRVVPEVNILQLRTEESSLSNWREQQWAQLSLLWW